ncbi:sugar phosphate isomerase/epimerase family protein [Aureliella helgolandensis]|uniref:Xylose isomerase-like TIM barrel n=1 Tax=Aureliella helgolandensis TaxID=2527968 RepID=A0A518G7Q4_9BACT|nr:sugar phosphate isomerase/epimerase [Aureliella helgolandensis]QDV24602.1 Xylose isomerase-like TIM barrel [Aureliella helgolandensis]
MMHHVSRRSFLAATAAVAAASRMASQNAWAAAPASGLQLGIQLYSLRNYDVDAALKHASDVGFKQVEFYSGMLPINASAEQLAEVKQKVADLGMTISAHGVNAFNQNEAANRKIFEFAKALGVKNISADPSPESFAQLDELVQEFDIRIAIHNHGPRHRYNRVIDVLRAIENHDERIGACADLGHFIRSGENATEVVRLLKGRLYGVHLKDFAEMQDKTEGVILGKGHLDVAGVIDALIAVDFPSDGALSLEYEENPEDPIADITQCYKIAAAAIDSANQARS